MYCTPMPPHSLCPLFDLPVHRGDRVVAKGLQALSTPILEGFEGRVRFVFIQHRLCVRSWSRPCSIIWRSAPLSSCCRSSRKTSLQVGPVELGWLWSALGMGCWWLPCGWRGFRRVTSATASDILQNLWRWRRGRMQPRTDPNAGDGQYHAIGHRYRREHLALLPAVSAMIQGSRLSICWDVCSPPSAPAAWHRRWSEWRDLDGLPMKLVRPQV